MSYVVYPVRNYSHANKDYISKNAIEFSNGHELAKRLEACNDYYHYWIRDSKKCN
jgi:hypothetical protein